MKMRVAGVSMVLCAAFLIAGWARNAGAQGSMAVDSPSKTILQVGKPAISTRGLSLLDPDRFSMQQNYIMSYSSGGTAGGLMGMYINSMEYRFNAPLILRLKVAYQTQTGMLFGRKDPVNGSYQNNQGRLFIPSFDVIYQPFKNTTIGFIFRDFSGTNPYGYGQSYGPSGAWGMDRQMYSMLYGWDRFNHAQGGR
jgi:hypothetical protein